MRINNENQLQSDLSAFFPVSIITTSALLVPCTILRLLLRCPQTARQLLIQIYLLQSDLYIFYYVFFFVLFYLAFSPLSYNVSQQSLYNL